MISDKTQPKSSGSSGAWKAAAAASPTEPEEVQAGSALGAPSSLPPLVQRTLKKLGPLPLSTEAVLRLLQLNPDDARSITAAIHLCPALTARLISVISSAAFGVSWRVASVPYAVQLLGPRRARQVALAYALRTMTRPVVLTAAQLEPAWMASIRKAAAAKLFCEAVDGEHAETAYALGLIQDLGLTMLMAADPPFYADPRAFSSPDAGAAEERTRFGLTHGAVGQELLLGWNASEKLQQLVLGHHRAPSDDAEPLAHATYIASLLPHGNGPIKPEILATLERYHRDYLRGHYETPDAFLIAVAEAAKAVTELRLRPATIDRPTMLARLISAVTHESILAQARLCKMEQAYRGQRESFTNLREQAFTDALTRLLNRRGFMELADRRMHTQQIAGRGICVMVFDLDGLKKLNDTHGHEVGDMLLRGFAKLLRRYLDEDDLIARFGGDEYAAMIVNVDELTARRVSERIVAQLHGSRLRLRAALELDVSCSVGAVFYDRSCGPADIETLLSQADHVMYLRKHSGKAGLNFQPFAPAPPLELGDSRAGMVLSANEALPE